MGNYVVNWRLYGLYGPPAQVPDEVEVCVGDVDLYRLEGPFDDAMEALRNEGLQFFNKLSKPVRCLENFAHGRTFEDLQFDPKTMCLKFEEETDYDGTRRVLRVYAKRKLLPAEKEAMLKMAEERNKQAERAEREQLRRLEEKYKPAKRSRRKKT